MSLLPAKKNGPGGLLLMQDAGMISYHESTAVQIFMYGTEQFSG